MTDEDRISYLNFCCGMLYGTLLAIRGQVDNQAQWEPAEQIDHCMHLVRPLMAKVYEFQAKPPTDEPTND